MIIIVRGTFSDMRYVTREIILERDGMTVSFLSFLLFIFLLGYIKAQLVIGWELEMVIGNYPC